MQDYEEKAQELLDRLVLIEYDIHELAEQLKQDIKNNQPSWKIIRRNRYRLTRGVV